jgi:SAM-dependent methyltransferase
MDGETLCGIADATENFVIANHFIEHTQDPIRTIGHFLRVLRPGGVIYMTVPHKLYTFDRDRPVTPLEHVVRDYRDGPVWSRRFHFEEWARLVEKTPEADVAEKVEQLMRMDYSIHYHVWTEIEFLEMLVHCQKSLGFPFSIELCQRLGNEVILIITKNWVDPASS